MKTFSEYKKYCADHNVDITKWSVISLNEKILSGKILTESEYLAKLFFEEMFNHFKFNTTD